MLNDLLELDAEAIQKLVEARVPCNEQIASHPTVSVRAYCNDGEIGSGVGMLEVINGAFGVDDEGRGPITAEFNDDGTLLRFKPTQR
jgi:hypothetical protein